MTVIFGGVTLMLSDDFYIKLKAALLNIIFSGAFLLSPYFGKERKTADQNACSAQSSI